MVRFLVSDDGISWVESRNGHELIKLEGAAAIEELDRVARVVQGLGSLLDRAVYDLGDNHAITLCVAAMVGWILLINAFFWKPIYRSTVDRYKFDA